MRVQGELQQGKECIYYIRLVKLAALQPDGVFPMEAINIKYNKETQNQEHRESAHQNESAKESLKNKLKQSE